jgi:hypothetical protein
MGYLNDLEFADDADISAAVTSCLDTGSKDGLTVIISDFFTDNDWKKAVDYLCYKNRQVLLVQILTPDEMDPLYSGRINLIDSEAADLLDNKNLKLKITRSMQMAYAEALGDIIADIKDFCVSRNAGFITVGTDKPIEKVLFGELLKTGIIA